jgi:glycosyltransferase involved in cell wall biosynthesis
MRMSSAAPAQPATICTIIAKNYMAQARCLAESFYTQHPDGHMFVLLVDEPDGYFNPEDEPFTVVRMGELVIPNFKQMAFRYTVLELSTAVKPFFLEYLFDRENLDHLIYLDPDIYCYQPLTPLLSTLQTHMMALTPHLLEPLPDDQYQPNELDILRVGIYNLGCIGLARTQNLYPFLRWWQQRLARDCVVDLGRGLFVDQGWMDLVPGLFDGIAIVRDPSCNVAFWNLAQRAVVASAAGWMVNGQPLTFYHFSGFDAENIEHISRHQNRYTLEQMPELRPLLEQYQGRLQAHGHATARHWPYGYSQFDNGVRIPDLVRVIWRANQGEQRWPTPFVTAGLDSFFQWLCQEADQSSPSIVLLSNLALQIYHLRIDLQQAFPDVRGVHRSAYAEWFIHDGAQQHQLHHGLVDPIRQSREAPALARQSMIQAGWLATVPRSWPELIARLQDLRQPLPEELLTGRPSLSRRAYYAIRNPLRRLGLHRPLKRLIGIDTASHILALMVHPPASPPAAARPTQPYTAPLGAPATPTRGLNLVGYLEHTSGVGQVARALLKAVELVNYPVVGIELAASSLLHSGTKAAPHTYNLLCVNADMTPHAQRTLGTAFFEQRYTIGFWHWETATFPLEWHDRYASLNELWVASDFVRDALAPLVSIPLHKIRLPIEVIRPSVVRRADLGLPDDRFMWLFAFDMRSYIARKNPQAVIESYRRAFGARAKKTQLVVKALHLEEYPEAAAQLSADLESVGGTLISRAMSRMELSALFATCDGYVSLHRCEGFGLTIAEAMALGKPVVATAYSGNMDFMTDTNSYPVCYRMIELDCDHGPYQRGTHWADPDPHHAAELMRQVFENRDDARQRGSVAAADIERWHSIHSAGQGVIERLKRIESGV